MFDTKNTHVCHRLDGKLPMGKFDITDVIIYGFGFAVTMKVAKGIVGAPQYQLLIGIVVMGLIYLANTAIKHQLRPYPKIILHFFNWWLGGVDVYEVTKDAKPVSLIRYQKENS